MKNLIGALLFGFLGAHVALADTHVLSERYPSRSAWDLLNDPDPKIQWTRIEMTFEVENSQSGREAVIDGLNAKVKANCADKEAEMKNDGTYPSYTSLSGSQPNSVQMIYSSLYRCK